MNIVKEKLEKNKRLPGEIIHLASSLSEGIRILRERENIEIIVLHEQADKSMIRKALTKLRRISLAEIMVIALFENELDIAEIYDYGANKWVPPIYKPELAVAYFEAFYRLHRWLPSINTMKAVEHIKDDVKMQCGDLVIDPAQYTVERNSQKIELTMLEFDMLYFLARNEGVVFSHQQLHEYVWKEPFIDNRCVVNCVYALRGKIEPNPQKPIYILSKYGAGYKFQSK